MLATRGVGPGVTIATFGFGPFEQAIKGFLATFIGLNASLQTPLQLSALAVTEAGLKAGCVTLETLVQSGLVDDTVALKEALQGGVDLEVALQTSDGSPEVGE